MGNQSGTVRLWGQEAELGRGAKYLTSPISGGQKAEEGQRFRRVMRWRNLEEVNFARRAGGRESYFWLLSMMVTTL